MPLGHRLTWRQKPKGTTACRQGPLAGERHHPTRHPYTVLRIRIRIHTNGLGVGPIARFASRTAPSHRSQAPAGKLARRGKRREPIRGAGLLGGSPLSPGSAQRVKGGPVLASLRSSRGCATPCGPLTPAPPSDRAAPEPGDDRDETRGGPRAGPPRSSAWWWPPRSPAPTAVSSRSTSGCARGRRCSPSWCAGSRARAGHGSGRRPTGGEVGSPTGPVVRSNCRDYAADHPGRRRRGAVGRGRAVHVRSVSAPA